MIINGLLTKCGNPYMMRDVILSKYIYKILEVDSMKDNKNVKVREKLGTMITCRHCGATFKKEFNKHYYCSEECRKEVEKAQWRERSKRYRARKKQLKLEQGQLEQMEQLEQDVDTTTDTTDTTDRCDN